MIGSLYLLRITFLVLLLSIAQGTWPTIASRFNYKQIIETKTLMANIVSPSKDQLAVVYKSGIQFFRLDVQIYNISGSTLIPFLNQTFYADTPKKIFWLQIGYFMVASLSQDSIYRILFFKVGGFTSTQAVVLPTNIYWSDWSTVLREDGVDYLFEVKSWIASKYKISGIDKFELVAKRNILLQHSSLPSDVIIWVKFKHLNCYYSSLLKQNRHIPYLQCLDFSSNYNDSFKLQPRENLTTTAIKYLPHPNKPYIYAIFKEDNVIYQISVPIEYKGKDINNQSIIVKPFGKVNPILKLLSIDFFGQSIAILAQIPGNQVQPERCLLLFKIDESLYFYQILRIDENYSSYNSFNKISQLSSQRLLINFNYEASQFTRILFMFTNQIKNQNVRNWGFLIATSCLFYAIFFFLAYQSCQSWHFAKLHLKKNIRQLSFIVELICFAFVYSITILEVKSTNLQTQVQQNFEYYSNSRLVGSYFTRLLYHLFYFTTTICMIFQLYYQFEYANKHLGYHVKHGLKKLHYVCYRTTKTYIKAFIHSIISVLLVYWLETSYCLSNYKVFQIKQLYLIIFIYQVSMVSAIMSAILASKAFSSFWLASSVILLVQFQISYLVETFYMIEYVKLVEYVLIFIWPQAVFSAFLQAIFSIQLRYLEEKIQFEDLGSASGVLLLITSLAYFLIIRYQLSKKDFNNLIKKKGFDQRRYLNRIGFNISNAEDDFRIQNQVPFLDVFIPCKLNLKNRLQKNNILEDVQFTAEKGPQGEIHSFIDFGNESKAALFKILINDEQSDTQIQSQIQGYVCYRQKASLSYCFDKDIFYPQLSVREHLRFYAFLKKYKATAFDIQQQVQQILNEFNIPDQFSNKRAKNLSGGYLKKMCLACAFIGDPEVIILDQPTVGLDLKFQKLFWEKVKLWKRKKLIIVFTSNITQAQSISDKIWYFEKAKLLDYHQMQMKKKKLEITLEFKTNNQLNQAGQMIRKFKESTHAIEKKYIQQKLFKSQLLLYRFQSKGIRQEINSLVTKILSSNKTIYTCHLSFKISQNLMGPKELVYYYQSGQHQRSNDQIQLIQLLRTNYTQNNSNRYTGIDDNDDNEGVQIINKLRNIKRVKNRAISQIKAVIYRRNMMRKNLHLNQAETIVTQFYLWFHLVVIIMTYNTYSSNYDSRQQFLKSISIYLILHSKMNHFYIKEKVEEFKECELSIGLSYTFYWLGNFIFDFCNLLLPIIISILIIMALQFFLSVSLLINFSELVFTSLIFCGGYLLTVIILSQFLSNQIQMHTVLMALLLFPLYLHEDSYFDLCITNQQSLFESIGHYFYPWTVRDWFLDKSPQISYLSVSVQFFIFSLTIYFIEIIKKFFRNSQSHKIFKNYVNANNKFIDNEKKAIEDCINKQEFIIGQNIIKFYKKNQCLKNIYFRVKSGEMIGFFGHNGCGKTTLFKIIVGRLSQSSGIIKYFGKQKKDISDTEKLDMSYCPQLNQFDHNLTLQQNIRVIGKIKGLDNQYISKFIAVFARFLSLKGNEQVFMSQLSVNQRKKANIMAAFLGFPKVIVLDQTSTGLDSDTSQRILRLLKIYANEFNNCVLLTSHNISEGQKFCNRVVIIKDGIIKASGTPSTLKNGPQQDLYKLVVYFKREKDPDPNKNKLKQILNGIELKMINIDERYRLGYSFDFASDLLQVFTRVWHLYEQGCVEKFSFYKHDLEEVAKFNMSQERNDPSNSIVAE